MAHILHIPFCITATRWTLRGASGGSDVHSQMTRCTLLWAYWLFVYHLNKLSNQILCPVTELGN